MAPQYIDPLGIAKQAQGEPIPALDDEAEAELVGELTSLLTESKTTRRAFDSNVSFNRAFVAGSQLVGLDENSQEYLRIVTMRSPDKFPTVDNKLITIYRAWIGNFLKNFGLPGVRPRNGTFKETAAAKGMSTYLEYIYDKEELQLKLAKAGGVVSYAPAGFMVPYWDRDGGETVAWCQKCDYVGEEGEVGSTCPCCLRQEIMRVDQALQAHQQNQQNFAQLGLGQPQEALPDPQNPPQFQQQNMPDLVAAKTGELKVAFHRWEEIYADPGALDPRDVRYFFIEIPLPVNVVKSAHPQMWEKIKTDDIVADRYLERDGSNIYYRTRKLGNHVWYREYHEMPSGLYPHGRVIAFCNDHILEMRENLCAWLCNRPDLYWFRGDVFDNSIYGVPWTEHNINLQREHNKLMSQKRAARELTLYPIVVGEDGSGVSKRTEMNKPGERILLKRGTVIQPYYLKTPDFPNWVQEEQETLRKAMQEKANVNDNDVGQAPQEQSGRDQALTEAQSDETGQSLALPNKSEWRQLNEAILQLGWYFTDSNQQWTVKRGGKLVSCSWSTIGIRPKLGRVYIIEQDVMTRNPVLRLTLAERLLQDGALGDKETGRPDMAKFAQVAGIMDLADFNDEDEEERWAAQIPELLAAGTQVTPLPWDRVKTIADSLLDWLRSDGRYAEDQMVQQVGQLWIQYAMAYMQHAQALGMGMTPDMLNSMPMMPMGPPQTNPTATAPGVSAGMGGGRQNQPPQPGVSQDAQARIQQADRAGEAAKKQPGTTI